MVRKYCLPAYVSLISRTVEFSRSVRRQDRAGAEGVTAADSGARIDPAEDQVDPGTDDGYGLRTSPSGTADGNFASSAQPNASARRWETEFRIVIRSLLVACSFCSPTVLKIPAST